MYEIAGVLGVDPEPFTLRELWWMIGGKDKKDWGVLSVICATMYNASGFSKKVVSPDEFNPYLKSAKRSRPAGTRSIPLKMFSKHFCKEPSDG